MAETLDRSKTIGQTHPKLLIRSLDRSQTTELTNAINPNQKPKLLISSLGGPQTTDP